MVNRSVHAPFDSGRRHCVRIGRECEAAALGDLRGIEVLRKLHAEIYKRWKKTRMANVVRDPREHPDAIIPDLSKPDPLVKFTKDDIAFVYGSKWKQRYFTSFGDDYYPASGAVGHRA